MLNGFILEWHGVVVFSVLQSIGIVRNYVLVCRFVASLMWNLTGVNRGNKRIRFFVFLVVELPVHISHTKRYLSRSLVGWHTDSFFLFFYIKSTVLVNMVATG